MLLKNYLTHFSSSLNRGEKSNCSIIFASCFKKNITVTSEIVSALPSNFYIAEEMGKSRLYAVWTCTQNISLSTICFCTFGGNDIVSSIAAHCKQLFVHSKLLKHLVAEPHLVSVGKIRELSFSCFSFWIGFCVWLATW